MRIAPSHVWIDLARGTVRALVNGETFNLRDGIGALGQPARENPFRAIHQIKQLGLNPSKWTRCGRIEVPAWALGSYPIQHHA